MIGRHWTIDLGGVKPVLLRDYKKLQSILEMACYKGGFNLIKTDGHKFPGPGGVTMYCLLCESHIAIHTYPENEYAALDIFACGKADIQAAVDHILSEMRPSDFKIEKLERGMMLQRNEFL